MIRVVSLFSGGGFAEEALRLASERSQIPVEVVMAVDSWESAARVRDANLSGPRTTIGSVKDMAPADLPAHDLVIGGPPCQDHSLAGKRACACDTGGPIAERCCLADFVRLSRGSAWLMENVRPRLIQSGWSEQFRASDFGDVTSRRRWFYSSHLLHVVPTPGPRRFGDIRDRDADRIAIAKRLRLPAGYTPKKGDTRGGRASGAGAAVSAYDDETDVLPSLTAHAWHGHETRGSVKLVEVVSDRTVVAMRSYPQPFTPIAENGMLGSVTSLTHDQPLTLKVGLRGHSASASAFDDDEVLGSLVSNSWHGNEISKLGPFVRCPSLLEMARAHSIPDSWDWAGTTKTQRGQIIANGWPIGMGTAVCEAMLRAITQQA